MKPTMQDFEAEFSKRTRRLEPVLIGALKAAYRSACESRAAFAKAGANESTFGTEVYHFAKHEILQAGEATGVLHHCEDETQRFRFEAEGYVYACHRVGRTEFDDIDESFPKGKGAASMIHEQQLLPMPGLGPDPKLLAAANSVVVAHMGNDEDGLCAVYLCIAAGDAEDEKIRRWEFTMRIWSRERSGSLGDQANASPGKRLDPEAEVEAQPRKRQRKRDDKEAK